MSLKINRILIARIQIEMILSYMNLILNFKTTSIHSKKGKKNRNYVDPKCNLTFKKCIVISLSFFIYSKEDECKFKIKGKEYMYKIEI